MYCMRGKRECHAMKRIERERGRGRQRERQTDKECRVHQGDETKHHTSLPLSLALCLPLSFSLSLSLSLSLSPSLSVSLSISLSLPSSPSVLTFAYRCSRVGAVVYCVEFSSQVCDSVHILLHTPVVCVVQWEWCSECGVMGVLHVMW